MERSNSFGIAMAGVIAIVMAPLVTASVQDVINAFLPTVMILIVGGAGIIGGGQEGIDDILHGRRDQRCHDDGDEAGHCDAEGERPLYRVIRGETVCDTEEADD